MSRVALGLVLLWVGIPLGVSSQGTAGIAGQLIDHASKAPLAGAVVNLLGARAALRSDTAGRFTQGNLAPGTYVVQVRALGYHPASWVLDLAERQTLSVVLELDPAPIGLPGVTVTGSGRSVPGFEERRSKGRGLFITEEDIAETQATKLGDILRTRAGVREMCRGVTCTVRMTRSPNNCSPNFFLDGIPANNATTMEMPSVGVIAVEIYRTATETPVEFLRGNQACGAIVIWTRRGL